MKVRLLIARATAAGSENRGDIVTVSDDEAVRMIEAGQAEPIRSGQAREKSIKKSKMEKAKK